MTVRYNDVGNSLESTRVLIAEDERIIALDLERMLRDAGADVVGPAYTAAEALALAQHSALDVAVLDVRLGRETSRHIAAHLVSRNVPLLFYTGQIEHESPIHCGNILQLSKPASPKKLIGALQRLLHLKRRHSDVQSQRVPAQERSTCLQFSTE